MNSNYDLNLTASVTYTSDNNDISFDFSFDPYNDCTDMEALKELAIEELKTQDDFNVESEGIDEDSVTVEITDFEGVPEEYANEKDVWQFAEAFAECEQDIDVVIAALKCGISPSDIDESYQGSYKDDEDFAYETAMSIGAIDKNAGWPNNCIDWEYAAKELMYDYSSDNGYYFRNF